MTEENEPVEKQSHLWAKGVSGNPAGRPRGSRSKLSEGFLEALNADFEQHGAGVIAKVRAEKPDIYLKVVANLTPARLEAMLEAQVNVQHEFADTNSIADILAMVGKEAGQEAAHTLAGMFGLQDRLPGSMKLIEAEAEVVCPHVGTTYDAGNGRRLPFRNCQCDQCREWRND